MAVREYALRLQVPDDLKGTPGDTVIVEILLDEVAQDGRIDSMTLVLQYDGGLMRPIQSSVGTTWLQGTLLGGWAIACDTRTPGVLIMHLAAPSSNWLHQGRGRLLRTPDPPSRHM